MHSPTPKCYVNITLYVILILSALSTNAQKTHVNNQNVLYNNAPQISSPNAAAIDKFIEFPTANYTGVPDIHIPLFSMNIKGVQLPVSISYHASGIKVDEVSSNVGMGWALQAGGIITVMSNGRLDDLSTFPFIDSNSYNKIKNGTVQSGYTGGVISCVTADMVMDPIFGVNPLQIYSGSDINLLKSVMIEDGDTEPDIYSFSFAGQSGKFFRDKDGIIRTIPLSDLKIETTNTGYPILGYKITDLHGNIFEFQSRDSSVAYHVNQNVMSLADETISRSYHLTKVTNPYNESITLDYTSEDYGYDLQKSWSRSISNKNYDCSQLSYFPPYFSISTVYNNIYVRGKRINSIKNSDGTVIKFKYSSNAREDLAPTQSLNEIELWKTELDDQPVSKFTLTQSYSGGRLILNSIQENDKPASVFTYNGILPERLSYSQDHYGYYNGVSNTTLLPLDVYRGFITGADRSVNETYAKRGILTAITHPTGGRTEYEYESNRFYIPEDTYVFTQKYIAGLYSIPDDTVSTTFTVPPTPIEQIKLNFTNTYDGTIYEYDECKITLSGPNGFFRSYVGNSNSFNESPDLQPGNYTLSIINIGTLHSASINVTWYSQDTIAPHEQLVGGLRVKKVKKFDYASNKVLEQTYDYNKIGQSYSSGVISNFPNYISNTTESLMQPACNTLSCELTTQSSNTNAPIGFGNGSNILYSDVAVYFSDRTKSGYTQYEYNVNYDGQYTNQSQYPYPPRILYDWTNGLLLSQTSYEYKNENFIPVQKTIQQYNYNNFNPQVHLDYKYEAVGLKIGLMVPPQICPYPCFIDTSLSSPPSVVHPMASAIYFGLNPYKIYTSWHKLESTKEIVYSQSDSMVSLIQYYYDNPNSFNVTRKVTTESNGQLKTEITKFAKDYNGYGFIDSLVKRNMLQTPIEIYQKVQSPGNNEYVISGNIFTYYPENSLPHKIYTLETTSPILNSSFTSSSMPVSAMLQFDSRYQEQGILKSYNIRGNITEIEKTDDITTSYLWDFGNTLNSAKVMNASLADIAYTSFEGDGKGNWNYSGTIQTNPDAVTGNKYYSLNTGSITKTGLTSTTIYTLSYWTKNASAFTILGTQTGYPIKRATLNDWNLFEHIISGRTTITISGTGLIDEIRFHPLDAQMTSYTHNALIGVSSITDISGKITYFEYDSMNRLHLVKDLHKNIIQKICYNYQEQPEDCSDELPPVTYYNTLKSGTFTRNNCATGQVGTTVTYTVAASIYSSIISQAVADSLAQADVNANGQTYANNYGTCILTCTAPCTGNDKKCINGVCETGIKVCTDSYYDAGMGMFRNTYHYEFSDNSWSPSFYEYDYCDCNLINCI